MAIGHFGKQFAQSVQKVAVSTRVQVCGGEGARSMRRKDDADAAFIGSFAQRSFDRFCDINHFVFLLCSDSDRFHSVEHPFIIMLYLHFAGGRWDICLGVACAITGEQGDRFERQEDDLLYSNRYAGKKAFVLKGEQSHLQHAGPGEIT